MPGFAHPLFGRFAPSTGLVTSRQTFVLCCQSVERAGAARMSTDCGPSADAITAALAPAWRAPTVLGNCGRCLVGARYAVAAARNPAHRAPLAGMSRLR